MVCKHIRCIAAKPGALGTSKGQVPHAKREARPVFFIVYPHDQATRDLAGRVNIGGQEYAHMVGT